MLVRSGIIVLKYWFSVSDEEQERRFRDRTLNPLKRWKFSSMDLESRKRWVKYSQAKDEMFFYTDINEAPWYVIESDDKRRARLNCINHILNSIPYKDIIPKSFNLPPLPKGTVEGYQRPPKESQHFVTEFDK